MVAVLKETITVDLTPDTASAGSAGYQMDWPDAERYLEWVQDRRCTPETLANYRRRLRSFYDFLPEGKHVGRETLAAWRGVLLESGYANRTVNSYVVVVNNFLNYVGHRECQLAGLPCGGAVGFWSAARVRSGPLFRTRGGKPLHRSQPVMLINHLAKEAQVPEERANPSSLQKMFLSTKADIMSDLEIMAEQAMDRKLEQEQLTVGWEA